MQRLIDVRLHCKHASNNKRNEMVIGTYATCAIDVSHGGASDDSRVSQSSRYLHTKIDDDRRRLRRSSNGDDKTTAA